MPDCRPQYGRHRAGKGEGSKCGVDIRVYEHDVLLTTAERRSRRPKLKWPPEPAEGDTSLPLEETESPKALLGGKHALAGECRIDNVWDVPGRNATGLYLLICFVISLIAALVVIVMTIMK
ncbi:MAG: hypothetical protein M9893_11755 [Pyrinomonadaceae bacterium]|nr:hypothetical protein [Pyrinomonadaceae bacterium]